MVAIIFNVVYFLFDMDKAELKSRRETLGFTQTSLAEVVGISANTVSRYETGTMEIPKYMELALEALEARQIRKLQSQSGK
jgi:transcriptional regulator with XRE-family HTH domain